MKLVVKGSCEGFIQEARQGRARARAQEQSGKEIVKIPSNGQHKKKA